MLGTQTPDALLSYVSKQSVCRSSEELTKQGVARRKQYTRKRDKQPRRKFAGPRGAPQTCLDTPWNFRASKSRSGGCLDDHAALQFGMASCSVCQPLWTAARNGSTCLGRTPRRWMTNL